MIVPRRLGPSAVRIESQSGAQGHGGGSPGIEGERRRDWPSAWAGGGVREACCPLPSRLPTLAGRGRRQVPQRWLLCALRPEQACAPGGTLHPSILPHGPPLACRRPLCPDAPPSQPSPSVAFIVETPVLIFFLLFSKPL